MAQKASGTAEPGPHVRAQVVVERALTAYRKGLGVDRERPDMDDLALVVYQRPLPRVMIVCSGLLLPPVELGLPAGTDRLHGSQPGRKPVQFLAQGPAGEVVRAAPIDGGEAFHDPGEARRHIEVVALRGE